MMGLHATHAAHWAIWTGTHGELRETENQSRSINHPTPSALSNIRLLLRYKHSFEKDEHVPFDFTKSMSVFL